MQRIFSRRALIDSALKTVPFLVALDFRIDTASATTLAPLDPNDPTAKALGLCRLIRRNRIKSAPVACSSKGRRAMRGEAAISTQAKA